MKSSSPSSSRTKNSCDGHTPTSKHENPNKNLVIIGLPLSTLNPSSLVFFKPTPTPHPTPHHTTKPILNLRRIVTESAHVFIGNLQGSIDRCLSFLQLLASNNPLLNTLHSASSAYLSFCQMNRRRQRGSSPLSNYDFAAILPGDAMAGLVVSNGISNFLNIYNTLLVVRLVLTWFPNSPPAIVSPLSTLCDPYLNIFRGLIPPLGGTLDLSPILAFLVLNALTSTASALPAELPSALAPLAQKKWTTRLDAMRSKGGGN